MKTTVDSIYTIRVEEFRRLQTSLRSAIQLTNSGEIDLDEIAMDVVYLDDDCVFSIGKVPMSGDYVWLTVDLPELTGKKREECENANSTSKINLEVLSINVLDSLIRVMKKALIIQEIRTLQ
jgi:hypothetical protein